MKRLLLILISFAWLPFIPEKARGCTCIEYDVPVCAAYWRTDAVFAGQLLDITPVEQKSGRQMPTVMLHFIVEQPFRGIAGNRVDVETLHGTSCDMTFEKGERYLVYASREQENNQLSTGACTRTRELKDANYDLDYIRTVIDQGATESILGRLLRDEYEPLEGLKVTVQRGDKTLEARTDTKGDFTISVPGPGSYRVRAFIPFAAAFMTRREEEQGKVDATDALTTFEYKVEIAKNQCNYRQLDAFKIDLHATAEVSGNVLNALGRPVNPGLIYLVKAADPDKGNFKRLEADGSFKFEGVAVGEYYLVVNPGNQVPDEDDAPYPRTYYPSTAEAGAATKIVVTEGSKLENLTVRVGPSWKERIVAGKVVRQNGRPAQEAHISLYDGDRYIRLIKLDDKGRFKFKVYGDFEYAIVAEAGGEHRRQSERVSIANEKSTGLTLILKPVD